MTSEAPEQFPAAAAPSPWLVRRWWIWAACGAELLDGLIGLVTLGGFRPELQTRLLEWRWRAYGVDVRPTSEKC